MLYALTIAIATISLFTTVRVSVGIVGIFGILFLSKAHGQALSLDSNLVLGSNRINKHLTYSLQFKKRPTFWTTLFVFAGR